MRNKIFFALALTLLITSIALAGCVENTYNEAQYNQTITPTQVKQTPTPVPKNNQQPEENPPNLPE